MTDEQEDGKMLGSFAASAYGDTREAQAFIDRESRLICEGINADWFKDGATIRQIAQGYFTHRVIWQHYFGRPGERARQR